MPALTTAEQILHTTVKLSTFQNGVATGSGTGFFYNVKVDRGRVAPMLITNKHVIEGANQLDVICHLKGAEIEPSGRFKTLKIALNSGSVVMHPDSDVDLCAISLGGHLQASQDVGEPIYYAATEPALIPTVDQWSNFDAIEEVIMVGCPRGIYDEANNLPIVRRGTTASALNKRYNGKDEFLVDMACFPGSSGSPVYIFNRDGYLDRAKNAFMMGQTRFHLLGILFSGPLVTNSGQIVLAHVPRIEVATMMHLGYVIRATQLEAIDKIVAHLASLEA